MKKRNSRLTLDRVDRKIVHRFEYIWNSSEVSNTDGGTAGKRIEICCQDLSQLYLSDFNGKERLLDKLKQSNSSGGQGGKARKLSFTELSFSLFSLDFVLFYGYL